MDNIKNEYKIVVSLLIILIFTGLCLRIIYPKNEIRVNSESIINMYYSYIFLWEYDRAYGLLSKDFKKSIGGESCFEPETPWGTDWYNVMIRPNYKIDTLRAGKTMLHTNIIFQHRLLKEKSIADIYFIKEGNRWKIDNIQYQKPFLINYDTLITSKRKEEQFNKLLKEGKQMIEKGRWKDAYFIFHSAFGINEWNSELNTYTGMCFDHFMTHGMSKMIFASKFGATSSVYYDNAVSVDSGNILARLGRGKTFLFSASPYGDVKKAIADFEYVYKTDENNMDVAILLALSYKKNRDYELALKYFKKVLKVNPNNKFVMKEIDIISKEHEDKDRHIKR